MPPSFFFFFFFAERRLIRFPGFITSLFSSRAVGKDLRYRQAELVFLYTSKLTGTRTFVEESLWNSLPPYPPPPPISPYPISLPLCLPLCLCLSLSLSKIIERGGGVFFKSSSVRHAKEMAIKKNFRSKILFKKAPLREREREGGRGEREREGRRERERGGGK